MAGDRVRAGEYAARVNAAADLVEAGVPVPEAARVLAGRFGCSVRQARRYAERAAQAGRAVILAGVLAGIELGAWDRRVACWLAGLDTATTLTIASWIERSRGRGAR